MIEWVNIWLNQGPNEWIHQSTNQKARNDWMSESSSKSTNLGMIDGMIDGMNAYCFEWINRWMSKLGVRGLINRSIDFRPFTWTGAAQCLHHPDALFPVLNAPRHLLPVYHNCGTGFDAGCGWWCLFTLRTRHVSVCTAQPTKQYQERIKEKPTNSKGSRTTNSLLYSDKINGL